MSTNEIKILLNRLFPIHRCLAGSANRETLKIIGEYIPLSILEIPSGSKVYDWEVPNEWVINDAWIKNSKGIKIVDINRSNLHVVGHSIPVHQHLSFTDISKHLHYLPDMPDAIPWRTSYYQPQWGFCLSYNDFSKLFNHNETFEVMIDSEHKSGSMSIGEVLIPGKTTQEILLSTYICHPSMANDNVSGMVLLTFLAKFLLDKICYHSYRILFLPETIGAIAYCAMHEETIKKINTGLIISTVGGPGPFGYKQSWQSNHSINRIIEDVLHQNHEEFLTYPFDIHGSDERQFSSQAFRVNVSSITKDKYYEYKAYHTSQDNLDFVKPEYIAESFDIYKKVINMLDMDLTFRNTNPWCEVMLGKRGLYPNIGGAQVHRAVNSNTAYNSRDAMLWLLHFCDGSRSLFHISLDTGFPIRLLFDAAIELENQGVLQLCATSDNVS